MAESFSTLTRKFDIERIENGSAARMSDVVAAEEPLQIRIQYRFKDVVKTAPLAMAMRTPGNDRELATGLLMSEGIVTSSSDIIEIRPLGAEPCNEILVELAGNVDVDEWMLARSGPLNASCGICGKRSIDAISLHARPLPRDPDRWITTKLISSLPPLLRSHQEGFGKTGGLHAAALVSDRGEIESAFEDIGRHNALDKLIGHELLRGRTPLSRRILFLSSRSSYELVQKAVLSGAPVLATVGGPSSLAIETARAFGLTLIGFVRDQRFNVYAGDWRLKSE